MKLNHSSSHSYVSASPRRNLPYGSSSLSTLYVSRSSRCQARLLVRTSPLKPSYVSGSTEVLRQVCHEPLRDPDNRLAIRDPPDLRQRLRGEREALDHVVIVIRPQRRGVAGLRLPAKEP